MPRPEGPFFLDTSFHIAYYFPGDQYHDAARAKIDEIRQGYPTPLFVTTDVVLQETIQVILGAESIGDLYDRAKEAINLSNDIVKYNRVYDIEPDMLIKTIHLFNEKNHEGYEWEFTDCSSFVFIQGMRKKERLRQLDIRQVLAFDKHYHEAATHYDYVVIC